MSDDLLKRLAFVSRAICDQWEDLTPEVRDGANAAACAIDEITRLQSQLAKARADVIEEAANALNTQPDNWLTESDDYRRGASDTIVRFVTAIRSLAHGGDA